jgi:ATP-dependent helicase/nuclease subunit B
MPNSNIYNIPAHLPFLDSLAHIVLEKHGHDPLTLSNITIFLPNRRACKELQQAFLRASNGTPLLLPKISPIGDDDEKFIFKFMGDNNYELPNLISPIKQRLILTKLIEKWQSYLKTGEKITIPQAAFLAIELASFLGEVQKEQLSFDEITEIVPDNLSKHWQVTLSFLSILIEEWPKILADEQAVDIHTQRNIVLKMQAEYWQANPAEFPVIAAGSTGSIPATANLLKTIANMPQGSVILPGLDKELDTESWEIIGETHPQFGLKQLLEYIGIERKDVQEIKANFKNNAINRSNLVREMMRPNATTYMWNNLSIAENELQNIELTTAASLQEEATIIALRLKETLQTPGKTAALITNQRDLAKRVSGILNRWDVTIDDSAGYELANTPQAIFLRLLAQMAADKAKSPLSLLKLFKHPFSSCGTLPIEFRNNVRKLELSALRGIRPNNGIKGILKLLDKAGDSSLKEWLENIHKIISPLLELMELKHVAFSEILLKHLQIAEKLAQTETTTKSPADKSFSRLWEGETGEQLKEFLDNLILSATGFKDIDPVDYAGLLDALMAGQTYRPSYGMHPRLSILSPIEARMLSYDLVIMGELNEGSWPMGSKSDPWMSRPMRADFGLPLPEKKIGQAAHDFAQVFSAPQIVMTRCEKLDGTQTIPSRWLLRLDAILKILKADNALAPRQPWAKWAALLNKPEQISACQAPEPRPKKEHRPNKFSVTAIEKLMRDPYSIYAANILRLKALDPLDQDPGAAEFGNFIHTALEIFTKEYANIEEHNRYNFLLETGNKLLKEQDLKAAIKSLWWPRFERIAAWFASNEESHRQNGVKILSEIKGEYNIECGGAAFTLHARADRIEIDANGKFTIIDYKTGTIPATSDIINGLSPQITLEGLIANNGGFNITGQTQKIAHWKLSGGDVAVEKIPVNSDISNLIAEADAGIKNLLAIFADETTAYLSCPNPEKAPRYNDFEHLARRKEWE